MTFVRPRIIQWKVVHHFPTTRNRPHIWIRPRMVRTMQPLLGVTRVQEFAASAFGACLVMLSKASMMVAAWARVNPRPDGHDAVIELCVPIARREMPRVAEIVPKRLGISNRCVCEPRVIQVFVGNPNQVSELMGGNRVVPVHGRMRYPHPRVRPARWPCPCAPSTEREASGVASSGLALI